MRTSIKRGSLAVLLATTGLAVSIGSAPSASADGVYACYQTGELIAVGSAHVNYIVPKAVTTDPNYCPPGTTAIGI